ncbi:unnamed protein product [Macrosiphum euphorbiae]|uniref:RING-type domain-containing protein n=1 Tax=Macrosiphum euphorbiae TaxID=13131 RepID=A0AAV0VFC1_9HEMI|nr:unnamed protein product [Macrosiphum euphorbiae]
MIKNTTDEIEKSQNEQDEILTVRRKLEKQTTYYDFCKHLLNIDPEDSGLWYFTGDECPVCLEKYKNMAKLNRCQHLLCVNCLTSWLETSHSCPLCINEIIGYDIFDSTLMRAKYVTATEHYYACNSKVDVYTSPVSDGTESVPSPPIIV